MKTTYSIEIKGIEDPIDFVNKWSKSYNYSNEGVYDNYINRVFDDYDTFKQMFYWKNGTGEKLSGYKEILVSQFWEQKKILIKLKDDFNWETFENVFKPMNSSTIWKIFLLHLMNPKEFPIFDQNVYRFYRFTMDGIIIKDPPQKKKEAYEIYKNEYRDWFNNLRIQYKLNHKEMDRSFFSFGQLLKKIDGKPHEIRK